MNNVLQFTELEGFTNTEKEMNTALCTLFNDWQEKLKDAESANTFWVEHFVSDGFYPCYTEQKLKILFLGRECHRIAGQSNSFLMYNAYKAKEVNEKPLNRYAFHKRLLKITHGLTNNYCPWATIPNATDLAETFGQKGGLSFAFMNLCKISNEEPEGDFNQCNQQQMHSFLEATRNSGRNFIAEEISLLAPDVIIAMNFDDKFHYLGEAVQLTKNADAHLWRLAINGKHYPLINTYHFAAAKEDQAVFYDPIVHCIQKAKELL